jgi:hypothetical protein
MSQRVLAWLPQLLMMTADGTTAPCGGELERARAIVSLLLTAYRREVAQPCSPPPTQGFLMKL